MTPSGHTSIDGPTEVRDLEKAETSKAVVRGLITDVLMEGGAPESIDRYISVETYIQHNAEVPDGLGGLIVEHWDNAEPVPSADESVNSGKF